MAGSHDLSGPDAGWYVGSDGRHFLLTLGASPGLRFVDFDRLTYEHLEPAGSHKYTWVHSKKKYFVTLSRRGVRRLKAVSPDGETISASADPHFGYSVSPLSYKNGHVLLSATLLMPVGARRVPAVVIAHGSGESHRDNLWYQYQADFLARRGIAVVLPDKRGCGQSTGDWHSAGFDDLARDLLPGVDALAKDPRVDKRRIGIFGLSQGGWIAPLAANLSSKVRFVVDVSGAAVSPGDQDRFEIRNSLTQHGLTPEQVQGGLEFQDAAQAYIRNGDWDRYIAKRSASLDKPWAKLAEEYPEKPTDWYWSWWRRVVDFDPVVEIGRLKVPCLVIFGAQDEHENVPVALSTRRLSALPSAGKSLTVKVFVQCGHAMGDPKTGWILTDYLQYLGDWIRSRKP